MTCSRSRTVVWLLSAWSLVALPAGGQSARADTERHASAHGPSFSRTTLVDLGDFDRALLRSVYDLGRPFSQIMRAADFSAWPVFVTASPGAWVYAASSGTTDSRLFAVSITLAEGSAILAALLVKKLVHRARPYVATAGIETRSRTHREGRTRDPHSFPSGHAAMSFSIAASIALQRGDWYVTLPVFLWATAVASSRVWLGVHYPSDVLAGAALGVATAAAARAIALTIVRSESDGGSSGVQFSIVRFTL